MTENQYVRANRTVLFTVLIVFGYIALTVMAALGVGDGHNKGKILIQFVVALAVIIVSVAANILFLYCLIQLMVYGHMYFL